MAGETLKRDQNFVTVLGGVTDDSSQDVTMLRVDPSTKRLLVSATGAGTGSVSSISQGTGILLTPNPITTTGTVALATVLQPIASLAGNSLKVLRVNAGETAVEYATITATPASPDTSIQFNNSGSFGGDAAFTYNSTFKRINLGVEGDFGEIGAPDATTLNTQGGSEQIFAGAGNGTGAGGEIHLDAGIGGATGDGGEVIITAGDAGGGNKAGGSVSSYGGDGQGSQNGGDIFMLPGAKGSTGNDGNVVLSSNSTSTSRNGGLFYILTAAGTPTGTPTTYSGSAPMLYDTSNNKLYFYNSGWQNIGGTSGTVTTVSVATANGFSGTVANATTTPAITIIAGAITPTTVNGLTISSTTGTLTVVNGKTLTVNKSITLEGTDSTTMTFPSTSATVARTDAAQTFTGTQTFTNAVINTNNAIAASGNAATVPVTARLSTVTNNSAATLTITITTASAVDGQLLMVRVLDFSAVAQTITWVNTENSTVSVPTTSNGSTTLFLTVGFIFNGATSKWRCIATA